MSDTESDDSDGGYRPNLGVGGRDTGFVPRPPEIIEEPPVDPPDPAPALTQFTSSYSPAGVGGVASINSTTTFSNGQSVVDDQTPIGTTWITAEQWSASAWDGTPIQWRGMTKEQLCAAVFPTSSLYVMKGLYQRFYQLNPFADVVNPTAAEVDNWNLEVVRHIRALFGITTPVYLDKCLMLRAQWGQERKYTTYWDTEYPGDFDSAYGPCFGGNNSHCGATFIPSNDDQVPYGAPTTYCSTAAGAEAIQTTPANLAWHLQLVWAFRKFLCSEGMTGHTGPFYGRELFGYAVHKIGSTNHWRIKWGGSLTEPV